MNTLPDQNLSFGRRRRLIQAPRPSIPVLVAIAFVVVVFAGVASIPGIWWRARQAEVALADTKSKVAPLESDQQQLYTVLKATEATTAQDAITKVEQLRRDTSKLQQRVEDERQKSILAQQSATNANQRADNLEQSLKAIRADNGRLVDIAARRLEQVQRQLAALEDAKGWCPAGLAPSENQVGAPYYGMPYAPADICEPPVVMCPVGW